ncbi:metal ABC transporter permease [Lagierella sp.]|uniref:metal ABC transporter permease n=1 Tax=Lagierella sp. TaxID=2849657 RepID=UPI0026033A08|nr:metal ABC transporter permease [Lagierella sp.]
MSIFDYDFILKSFLAGLLIALSIPLIGTIMVCRKSSNLGDALSHSSLAGVAFGLIIGINPVIGSIISCLIASLFIDFLRKKFPKNADMAIAIVMSLGVGLAAVASDFIPGSKSLNSFLFGSIAAISNLELLIIALITSFVIFFYIRYYTGIVYIIFDEKVASLTGLPVRRLDFMITLLTALSVGMGSRIVGVLTISSLMVLPVAGAIKISASFRKTVINSVMLGVLYVILGLLSSFYLSLKPGGSIVIIGVVTLIAILMVKGDKN